MRNYAFHRLGFAEVARTPLDGGMEKSGILVDASLLAGVLPAFVSVLGAAGMTFLLFVQARSWWRRTVPASIAGAVAVVAAADGVLELWKPFPDPLPARVLAWTVFVIFGFVLTIARLRWGSWVPRVAVISALFFVILASGMKINAFYGYWPTLGAALNISPVREINFAEIARPRPILAPSPDTPLSVSWRPAGPVPAAGEVTRVSIPGIRSGFHPRPGFIYVPPAYLASPRPLLPVLMLIAGQPGGPRDWFVAGGLPKIMDAFAAEHGGLAPIVVVPDATGSALSNPMCLDSALGKVETYLADDVPGWLRDNLQIDPNPRHWAIAGFSYGGTCSLQIAVRRPDDFPTFLDISGQREPTLGSRKRTVSAAFGGDLARFQAANPMDILASTHLIGSAAIIAVGANDHEYGPQASEVYEAARTAGISAQLLTFPGNHSWAVATVALRTALPWLAARANLLPAH